MVVAGGLAPSREKARRLVLAGEVLVNNVPIAKPGAQVDPQASLRLRHPPSPFVGRGGEKLDGTLDALELDVAGASILDVGASTGGFCDCLLRRGAARITALDVGKGQLDWKLRTDPRVKLEEGVNARYLVKHDFPQPFDLITIDVSFISLTKILPAVAPLIHDKGKILALVKPQFELSRAEVKRGGVITDPDKHLKSLMSTAEAAKQHGLAVAAVAASPITGAEGNQEFFILLNPLAAGGLDANTFTDLARKACGME